MRKKHRVEIAPASRMPPALALPVIDRLTGSVAAALEGKTLEPAHLPALTLAALKLGALAMVALGTNEGFGNSKRRGTRRGRKPSPAALRARAWRARRARKASKARKVGRPRKTASK